MHEICALHCRICDRSGPLRAFSEAGKAGGKRQRGSRQRIDFSSALLSGRTPSSTLANPVLISILLSALSARNHLCTEDVLGISFSLNRCTALPLVMGVVLVEAITSVKLWYHCPVTFRHVLEIACFADELPKSYDHSPDVFSKREGSGWEAI